MSNKNGWFSIEEKPSISNTHNNYRPRGNYTPRTVINNNTKISTPEKVIKQDNIDKSYSTPNSEEIRSNNLEQKVHSQTIGKRGPVLEQDTILHETLETFVNSTRLDRIVHTKGFGAFGYFETTESMSKYTEAPFLQKRGQKTPVATRFSLAVSNKGTPDTSRNVRGFSTKFYTEDGIFDLLCNHIPVFLVRDAMRFPEAIKSLSPSPVNNLIEPDIFWGFIATAPEAINFITWLYSDVGTLKSVRHMRSYGVNTYIWKNNEGKRHYIKYHLIPVAGEQYISSQEAVLLAGQNPDISAQDLYDTIAKGTPVEYELKVQIMDPEDENILPFDPLDDTKIWNESRYPLMGVGKLVLNENPKDYKEEIDNLAFSPTNLVKGLEISNDKMLQGRSTIYWDAQRHRLGNDFRKLSVNKQSNWKPTDLVSIGDGLEVSGQIMRSEIDKADNFKQAGERYNSLSETQKNNLVNNIANDLVNVSTIIRNQVLQYFKEASNDMYNRLINKLNT